MTRTSEGLAMRVALGALALGLLGTGCRGQGEGEVTGTAVIPLCALDGAYTMAPDFYQSYRTGTQLTVRFSKGGGELDYTDHFMFTFADTEAIHAAIQGSTTMDAMGRRTVELPVGAEGSGTLVSARFVPNWTCGRMRATRLGRAVSLWSYSGTITLRSIDRGAYATNDAERFTDVTAYNIQFHDPRPVGTPSIFAPPGIDPNSPVGPPGTSFTGWFRFQHSRVPPAQVFPFP